MDTHINNLLKLKSVDDFKQYLDDNHLTLGYETIDAMENVKLYYGMMPNFLFAVNVRRFVYLLIMEYVINVILEHVMIVQ